MRKRVLLALVLIASLLSLVWLASSQSTASRSLTKAEPSTTPSMPSKEAVSAKLATLERGWVKNEGQWDERALFSAPGYFGNTWITKDGELLHVAVKKEECKDKTEKAKACPSRSWVISERWVGGKVQTIKGEEELQTKVSYFIGNDPSKHRSNLSTYRYVSLGEVWSGVEVKLKATQKTVEKLFYVQPGADPSKIQVQLNGAKGLKLSKDGEIIIKTGLGDLKLSKPIAWQEKDGKKLPVEVSYKLIGKNRYSFEVAKADPSLPIVIDPILQSTYLGGMYEDYATALAISSDGYVYVAGQTNSTDFPNTTGGAQENYRGSHDAFVARLNPNLQTGGILQSTYLGGSDNDYATALAISSDGYVYVAGYTYSTNFPTTPGVLQPSKGDYSDTFVARLSANLANDSVFRSTYLGGNGEDRATAIAISSTGDVYVAGWTWSTNFPTTPGVVQPNCSTTCAIGTSDAFVARLSANLANDSVFRSTYLGGSNQDIVHALAISSTGDVYVAGRTWSNNFPGTTGGAQASRGGGLIDAFVARLSSDFTSLQSTYLGGSGDDYATALAMHPTTGEVYVAGYTGSTDFPNTTGGAQASRSGSFDVFVARLNPNLQTGGILQSTYLGGSNMDFASAIAIHPTTGEVYVAGETYSTNFPKTSGGAQAGIMGPRDAFVARLTADLAAGYVLSINPIPTNGTVTSSPGGINCGSGGSTCSASFSGTVTLTATPDAGYTFAGWTGDCSVCSTNTTCTINMNADKTCSANFTASGGGDGGSGGGGGSGSGSGSGSSGGGGSTSSIFGCSMTGSASSMAGFWNILVWLSVPFFALVRRIRRK
jgi:uncharacterized repeat protein (TIGR02543 family)